MLGFMVRVGLKFRVMVSVFDRVTRDGHPYKGCNISYILDSTAPSLQIWLTACNP